MSDFDYQVVPLQFAISGLKISKDGRSLRFEEYSDVVVIEITSQRAIRRVHDPRDGRHEEALWILVGGHSYAVRERISEDDIHVVSAPFPRHQTLMAQSRQKNGYSIIPKDKTQAIRQFLKDYGY
ncbi:hypothetical protein APHAL10511_008353 [Amanita phalloides]|nr:hypothetical protein APHAL10511_008353 [Amanita phalloides]